MFTELKFKVKLSRNNLLVRSLTSDHLLSDYRFFIVVAPAGYGKTVFAHELSCKNGYRSSWICLDEKDNDIRRFFSLFRIGLWRILGTSASVDELSLCYAGSIDQLIAQCDVLLQKISSQNEASVLVLDDFHVVQNNEVLRILDQFISNWPESLKLIITSREQVTLKFGVSYLNNNVCAIGVEDLRFSMIEIESLLKEKDHVQRSSLGLLSKEIFAITNGWPVAVQLAVDHIGFTEGITMSNVSGVYYENIANYFLEQVYGYLNEDYRHILIAASLCDRFRPDLITFVTKIPNAEQTFKVLLDRCFFQRFEYEGKKWYRLHSLYREFILGDLEFLSTKVKEKYVSDACSWFSRNGYLSDALVLSEKYGDKELLIFLLDQYGEFFLDIGAFELLDFWLSKIDRIDLDKKASLLLLRAWSFQESQKLSLGPSIIKKVKDITSSTENSYNDESIEARVSRGRIETRIKAFEGYLARVSNNFLLAEKCAKSAIDIAKDYAPDQLCRLYTTLGQDSYLNGDCILAISSLKTAISYGKQYSKMHDSVIALGYLVATYHVHGKLREAISDFTEFYEWAKDSEFMFHKQAALLDDLLIDIYRELGDIEKALSLSDSMVQFCENTTPGLHHLVTFIRRYRIYLSKGDWHHAGLALIQAETYQEVLGVSWAFGWAPIGSLRAEYELTCGVPSVADSWFSLRENYLLASNSFSDEGEQFILVKWYLKRGEKDKALSLLAAIKSQASLQFRHTSELKACVQEALITFTFSRDAGADLFIETIKQFVGTQHCSVYLDFGFEIMDLLNEVRIKIVSDSRLMDLVNKLLSKGCLRWPNSNNSSDEKVLSAISSRQLDVLKLLVAGKQDKEIARILDISPGTVKTHLRSIYRKLDVTNRSQAVTFALENGIRCLN